MPHGSEKEPKKHPEKRPRPTPHRFKGGETVVFKFNGAKLLGIVIGLIFDSDRRKHPYKLEVEVKGFWKLFEIKPHKVRRLKK